MTTSTMITMTMMVPMPINMGFLSDAGRPRGTGRGVAGLAGCWGDRAGPAAGTGGRWLPGWPGGGYMSW